MKTNEWEPPGAKFSNLAFTAEQSLTLTCSLLLQFDQSVCVSHDAFSVWASLSVSLHNQRSVKLSVNVPPIPSRRHVRDSRWMKLDIL